MNKEEILTTLTTKDTVKGYRLFEQMEKDSAKTAVYYDYIDDFAKLLDSKNAYVRIRSFSLICYQARWDEENRIDKYIDKMLMLLNDDKPIVVRKCLEALHELLVFKNYNDKVLEVLNNMHTQKYADSMKPLIDKDIAELMKNLI